MSGRNPYLFSLLLVAGGGALSSCEQDRMTSRVEEEANAAKNQLPTGAPASAALSYLKNAGFSNESSSLGNAYRDAPTFLFRKQIILRRWWGARDAHQILVTFRVDASEKVASPKVLISGGGFRGL
ncbi:hypothetical protein FSB78_10335 [Sphingomonas ginsenosidivorax]|uniref:Uncharacterized protein n=1 Tax=Sphingomonas ginsenosidivorax TaxID=862135 RepID=A0A5C6UFP7_9SPHN|nr:hypothetical protein [Sphingomonas ginsenosidivorax]TXC71294.1 hypothetical protein FSB78_10335 [Sphingomonas ginsenosidivorax]